jgi:hypothetical protein
MSWIYGLSFFPFCFLDYLLTKCKVQSPYYILHVLHNILVVHLTYSDVVHTLTDFQSIENYTVNYEAVYLVAAFHLYHMAIYMPKFRYDDYLHHILMIAVAIPLGLYTTPLTPLMGYSLFFATGLPGAISYFSLFLNRNHLLDRMTEKRINTWINVWIRSPGCVSHAILTLTWLLSQTGEFNWKSAIGVIPAALMYWNGQYFMRDAVWDLSWRVHTWEKMDV